MIFETFRELNATLRGRFDEVNSAARRLRLQVQHAVGRTLVQAQPAVDALIELREVERCDLGQLTAFFFVPEEIQCFRFSARSLGSGV